MTHPLPSFYNNLDQTLTHTWAQLARGVSDRRCAFHTPTLATIGLDCTPKMRTVVLRACDVAHRLIRVHTDIRTAKISEIEHNSVVALHAYDVGQKFQVRVAGTATHHKGDLLAKTAWALSQPMSRAGYAQEPGPGRLLVDPTTIPQLPAIADGRVDGFENFGIILIAIHALECLYLGHQGHRRARFTWDDGALRATWLAP